MARPTRLPRSAVASAPLPADLESRLAALESGREAGADFDRVSLYWLALLGIILPVGLLMWGWFGSA